MREMLARKDISLELQSPPIFASSRPASRLKELVESAHYDAWILYQTNERVQEWFLKQKIPSIVRGQVYPGIDLPSLDLDWRAAGVHSASLLVRNGHRSIGLMVPDTQLQGLFEVEKGIQSALGKMASDITLHTITEQGTAEAVASSLYKICHAENPPTAIITTRSRQVLTLISWLASHRLNIPQNMSLVSLTADNVFEALVPRISYYKLDPSIMARGMVRKLETVMKSQASEQKLLIPDFVVGGSVRDIG